MKKILVTGSNGLLGQKLIEKLSKAENVEVVATARGENRLPFAENYKFVSLDITKKEEVETVFEVEKPDVVIHTAAMTNVDQCETEKVACWDLNVKAVEYLLEASKKHNSFFVHLSTDFIFDGKEGPYDEKAEANPLSFYGWSKYAAEKLVINSDVKWAIARTVLVYGIAHDMSRTNIILWVKNSLEQGKSINVVNDQWRTPTLAEDLADGCILIAQKEAEGIFNISGKDLLNPFQMAIMTADYFNLDKTLITEVDGTKFTQPAKRPAKTGFILDKPIEVLGYNPKTFQEGIAFVAEQIGK
ncbi:SDR family oxidoreductase [Lacihabitans soyangensis]|uniref:dTDP-4-dehydrorhamnose reductase n=1 Tax=Lacihabitans soyangensis TaxID=869394 RepID=A0AAE3KUC1_9BACT|nr:SDR family oxidoreductase [Lacihabitans soyangensis]MCP9764754.1 SDR family oxidoreductase [Lacihabitans soyangensis]